VTEAHKDNAQSEPRVFLVSYSIDPENVHPVGKAVGTWCKQFNSASVEWGYVSTTIHAFMTCIGTKLPFSQICVIYIPSPKLHSSGMCHRHGQKARDNVLYDPHLTLLKLFFSPLKVPPLCCSSGLEWSEDTKSYAGGSLLLVGSRWPDRSKVMAQIKRGTLVLQVGGWAAG
jgi:hypothetical protein